MIVLIVSGHSIVKLLCFGILFSFAHYVLDDLLEHEEMGEFCSVPIHFLKIKSNTASTESIARV